MTGILGSIYDFAGIFDPSTAELIGYISPIDGRQYEFEAGSGGSGDTLTPATWANRGDPVVNSGNYQFITNFGAGGTLCRSNGVRWKPVDGAATLLTLETVPTITGASEAIFTGAQLLLPAGLWQQGDSISCKLSASKDAGAGTATFQLRCGTAGAVADQGLFAAATPFLATTARSMGGNEMTFRRASATTIQKLGSAGVASGNNGASSTSVYPSPVTVSDLDANAVYISLSQVLTIATTETVALNEFVLRYHPSSS